MLGGILYYWNNSSWDSGYCEVYEGIDVMYSVLRCIVYVCLVVAASSLRRVSQRLDFAHEEIIHVLNNSNHRVLAASSPEDHRITSLPGLSSPIEQFAGHLTIDSDSQSTIFYWLFPSSSHPDTAPLIIWMNGGPGCSSMDGLFLELGPLRLNGEEVVINPHSWHHAGNLLFIDQPVGTGLSYTRRNTAYPKNDAEVNRDLYKALVAFLSLHTSFSSRDIYLTGESHAGHYIPSFAAYVAKKNAEATTNGGIVLKIAGLAIGNGWIDPYHQYDVSDYAHGHGMITAGQRNALKKKEAQCQRELDRKVYSAGVCFSLLDDVVAASGTVSTGRVEMYDSRVIARPGSERFPVGHTAVENYLNREDVRTAIHASSTPHRFAECTDPPYHALSHQDGLGVIAELSEVLNATMPVLMFSGQYDIICHHLGTERALSLMEWSGKDGWLTAGTSIWVVDNHPAGYMKEFNNLQFLVVLDAGHMVPMSRPVEALDMIKRFVSKQSFKGGSSKLTTLTQPIAACPSPPMPLVATKKSVRFNADSTLAIPELVEAPIVDGETVLLQLMYTHGVAIVLEPEYRVVLVPSHQSSIQLAALREGTKHYISIYAWNPSNNHFSEESRNVEVVIGCGAQGGAKPCCGGGKCVLENDKAQCICSGGKSGDLCEYLHDQKTCNMYDTTAFSGSRFQPSTNMFSIDDFCHSSHLKSEECNVPMQFSISSIDARKTPSYFSSLVQLFRYDLSGACKDCKSSVRDVRIDIPFKDTSVGDVHFVMSGSHSHIQQAVYALITQSYFSASPLVQSTLLGSVLSSHISIARATSANTNGDSKVKLLSSSYVDWLSSPALIVVIVVGIYAANLLYRKYIGRGGTAGFRNGSRK